MVMKKIEARLEKLAGKVNKLEAKVSVLNEETTKLKIENQELRETNDKLEQYTRRNNIRIFGVKEEPREDTDKQVLYIFKEIMDVPITINEIDRSHRTGRYKTNGKPRPIIVKFTSYRSQASVFNSKKKLKGSGLIIKED